MAVRWVASLAVSRGEARRRIDSRRVTRAAAKPSGHHHYWRFRQAAAPQLDATVTAPPPPSPNRDGGDSPRIRTVWMHLCGVNGLQGKCQDTWPESRLSPYLVESHRAQNKKKHA